MTKEQKQALIEDLDRVSSECVTRKYVSNGKDELECAFCLRDLDAVDSDYAKHTDDCLTQKLQKHVEILEESIERDS
jgi:hypothetical protein